MNLVLCRENWLASLALKSTLSFFLLLNARAGLGSFGMQVRHLFSWTADARAADDYERKILNGIMGVQKPDGVGEMLYMTPLGAGRRTHPLHIAFFF